MRKLNKIKIGIITIILLTSFNCTSDDDYPLLFNPPDWTIGKWMKGNDNNILKSITFTNNDVILELPSGTIRSLSKFVNTNDDGGIDVTETISDSVYINILTYNIDGNQFTNTANRISTNEILYNNESYIKE